MTGPRIVSLCAGFGGLDLGTRAVLGGELVAYAEVKAAAVALLAARFPGVENFGDLTVAPWLARAAEIAADIVTVGWPCQPHSSAGLRLGEEDPRAIWPAVLDVVAALRPLVVGENVARVCTNGELARVVRSLAAIGYVGAWRCLPAGDPSIGAPHKRDRLMLVAVDATRPDAADRIAEWVVAADVDRSGRRTDVGNDGAREPDARRGGEPGEGLSLLPTPVTAYSQRSAEAWRAGRPAGNGAARERVGDLEIVTTQLLPTPTQNMTTGAGTEGWEGGLNLQTAAVRLLPTHRVSATRTSKFAATAQHSRSGPSLDQALEIAQGRLPREFDAWDELPTSWHPDSSIVEPEKLLPTPTVIDSKNGRNATSGRQDGSQHHDGWTLCGVAYADRWGAYAAAIARWEPVVGRPAPDPTLIGPKGGPQLSPVFVEWLMGLPEGWVTAGAPRLGVNKRGRWTASGERNAFLSLLGDGVVPQWAAVQLAHLLPLALDAHATALGADFFAATVTGLTLATSRREVTAILAGAPGRAPEHDALAVLRGLEPDLPTGPLPVEAAA